MKILGEKLNFETINKDNIFHQQALGSLSKSGEDYLGKLSTYPISTQKDSITGNDYIVTANEDIIGYLALGQEVDTPVGKTASVYYGVLEEYYGRGYGSTILNEISKILKERTNVRLLIANVDKKNTYSLKATMRSNFKMAFEDEDDIQLHRHL